MNIDLTIKNYRCFSIEKPIIFPIRNGFTSLIGKNNSGKSTLLKFFYELRPFFSHISEQNNLLNALRNGTQFNNPIGVNDIEEIFCNTNNQAIVLEFKVDTVIRQTTKNQIIPIKLVVTIPRNTTGYKVQIFHNKINLLGNVPTKEIGLLENRYITTTDQSIDMQPFFHSCNSLSKTVYIGPFRNAVNIGGNQNYYDMTIGQQFITLWDQNKSGTTKKSAKASPKLTEDIKNMFGFDQLEINASHDNQTLQIIINNKPYRLEELGSGLAQFIVILANIAIKNPCWILIDEPELNLHPSLQIDFLTTLTSYASEGIMFATHNIGLARASADYIYSVRLDEKGLGEVNKLEDTYHLSEFLGELSFSGYQDLGFDKILLVEGTTEVKTIQQFLRKYHKDHKILLLPLGGSSLINEHTETELNEIKRISPNISALIDSEKIKDDAPLSKERDEFTKICKKAQINCHVLNLRALENYLTENAIITIKGEKYKALSPFEKLGETEFSWGNKKIGV